MKKHFYLLVLAGFLYACSSPAPKTDDAIQTDSTTQSQENTAPTRVIAMEGAQNFRDLGGYKTNEGKITKWNTLYRSDKLSTLTDNDMKKVEELGIKTVIDLRTDIELEKDPSRLPSNIVTKRIPIWREEWNKFFELYQNTEMDSLEKIARMEEIKATVADSYTAFPDEFKAEVAQFIEIISNENNYPILFHCSAGTDRTGFLAALTLSLLDVPENVIVDDYAMSAKLRLNQEEKDVRIVKSLDKLKEYGGAEEYVTSINKKHTNNIESIRTILLNN